MSQQTEDVQLHATAVSLDHTYLLAAEICDGAGRLLAAAVKGISNGLHSRATLLLKLLLQENLISPAHFKAQQAQHVTALTSQRLRAIMAAVSSIALDQLLQHLRRGKGQVLWECVLSEAHSRLKSCLALGEIDVTVHFMDGKSTAL